MIFFVNLGSQEVCIWIITMFPSFNNTLVTMGYQEVRIWIASMPASFLTGMYNLMVTVCAHLHHYHVKFISDNLLLTLGSQQVCI
jgi:hypothetical protein